jgi:mono/diheme cytochrome c family protein
MFLGAKHPGIRRLRVAGAVLVTSLLLTSRGWTQVRPPQADSQQVSESVARQYCIGCHNDKLKTGGIVLDRAALGNLANGPGSNAEVWERAIRQLHAKSMPPVVMPRPDQTIYQQLTAYLETAAKPNAGKPRKPLSVWKT